MLRNSIKYIHQKKRTINIKWKMDESLEYLQHGAFWDNTDRHFSVGGLKYVAARHFHIVWKWLIFTSFHSVFFIVVNKGLKSVIIHFHTKLLLEYESWVKNDFMCYSLAACVVPDQKFLFIFSHFSTAQLSYRCYTISSTVLNKGMNKINWDHEL